MGDSFPTDIKVPELCFKIGDEPRSDVKINQFPSYELVKEVKSILSPQEFQRIKSTFLGPVLKIIGRGLIMSGKMVHCFLSRSLKVSKSNEIWVHFGGQPMRFSIREFHMNEDAEKKTFDWASTDQAHTCEDVVEILRKTNREDLDERFCLAMLILIEGIFFQRYKGNKFPAKKLKKAQDIEVIMNHPWGRDAYKLLLSSIKKNVPSNLVKNKYDLHGYPLALHLWILESVPLLQSSFSTISVIESPQAFLCEKYTSTASPSIAQVENIEALKHLKVISILPSIPGDEEDSVALEDINDQDLSFLMEVINKGYKLTVDDWTKGCLDVGAVMEEIAIMSYQLRNKETLKPSSSGESIMDKLDNLYKIVQEGFRTTNTRLSKIEEHLNIPKAANTDDQCDTENDKQYETENEYDPMPATSPLMTENDLQVKTTYP
ncbi:hypothetical protein CARUB_v10021326mg [Capsella rubella]|uniref:DUF1985 domain-containing protein n=1 Tax=Capsella rubella TaxID=81985 RepID=R0IB45_9BRAS|nr:hypothetical protein CARUB_v10021326mg [Capsella rubella]